MLRKKSISERRAIGVPQEFEGQVWCQFFGWEDAGMGGFVGLLRCSRPWQMLIAWPLANLGIARFVSGFGGAKEKEDAARAAPSFNF